jgi:hypothetical protein
MIQNNTIKLPKNDFSIHSTPWQTPLKANHNAWGCIAFPYSQRNRKQPTSDIGHFGTPYKSNRLISNGSWPRPPKNDNGMWRPPSRVYDIISRERRDKMACNHDIRESENSGNKSRIDIGKNCSLVLSEKTFWQMLSGRMKNKIKKIMFSFQ